MRGGGWPAVKTLGSEAPVAGSGFYVGTAGNNTVASYAYIAPKSTETTKTWGSYNVIRNTSNVNDGLPNTNTLHALGSTAHPAAYYCKSLTTGGYNTWYLPAINEWTAIKSGTYASGFPATDKLLGNTFYWSSTESNGKMAQRTKSGGGSYGGYKNGTYSVRAVRRALV